MVQREQRAAEDPPDVTVWLVEDNDLYRTTITAIINKTGRLSCEKAFVSCEDALKSLENEVPPDVMLMDIGLPGMSGIEGVKRIKAIIPSTHMVMLTAFEEDEKIFEAICAGASGYLLKSSPAERILEAVDEVLRGGAPMNAQIARRVLDMFSRMTIPKGDYGLTEREKEILRLMVDGLTKKQIADKIFLSYFTIDTHIKNIYTKLQVHTRSGAVAKALKERLF
jgi:DNA-binding NarL/FixJ family response regulator